jgi:pyridinium-3,5-biscarboxylic acid mononucleotide synthase
VTDWLRFDWDRAERSGVPEAVLGTGKRVDQLVTIVDAARARDAAVLFTRLDEVQAHALREHAGAQGDLLVDDLSRTASRGRGPRRADLDGSIAVVAAGSSDQKIAAEAVATLRFHGVDDITEVYDVGVAGIWRLLEQAELLSKHRVVIAVAGMEGALFSVVAGLVPGLVIAVPSSVGYGVASDGRVALNSALSSCSPGVVTVNVDNGFGGAIAAIKALGAIKAPGAARADDK